MSSLLTYLGHLGQSPEKKRFVFSKLTSMDCVHEVCSTAQHSESEEDTKEPAKKARTDGNLTEEYERQEEELADAIQHADNLL